MEHGSTSKISQTLMTENETTHSSRNATKKEDRVYILNKKKIKPQK